MISDDTATTESPAITPIVLGEVPAACPGSAACGMLASMLDLGRRQSEDLAASEIECASLRRERDSLVVELVKLKARVMR